MTGEADSTSAALPKGLTTNFITNQRVRIVRCCAIELINSGWFTSFLILLKNKQNDKTITMLSVINGVYSISSAIFYKSRR